VFDIYDLN